MGTQAEIDLLLCCARSPLDAENAERVRGLLQQAVNWNYLLRTACRHKVTPLLYSSLKSACPEAVPGHVLAELQEHYAITAVHSLALARELVKLIILFENHGIRAMPFKGAVLAASIYRDMALRQFSDLDVVVAKRDIIRANELLISLGFKRHDHFPHEAIERQFQHDHRFVRRNLIVEVHWAFAERFFALPLNPESLWPRAEYISLEGASVPNLGPEDLLLVLCVHGTRHCWQRLSWICDIAQLLQVHRQIKWDQVLEQSRTLGAQRMLFLGLLLAHDLLGLDLPEQVLQKMRDDAKANRLAKEARDRLFTETPCSEAEEWRFYLKARERLRDRIRYCLRLGEIPVGADYEDLPRLARYYLYLAIAVTPTERDWAFLSLPASFSFLYYLLRPIRMLQYLVSPIRSYRMLRRLVEGRTREP